MSAIPSRAAAPGPRRCDVDPVVAAASVPAAEQTAHPTAVRAGGHEIITIRRAFDSSKRPDFMGLQSRNQRWIRVLKSTKSPKKGRHVGNTKRGKGTEIMAIADGGGLPIAITIASASPHEVTLVRKP